MVLAQESDLFSGDAEFSTAGTFIVNFIEHIISPLVTLLFAGALVYFFYGLFKLMQEIAQGGEGKDGKTHMLWGIVGLVIMFSVWGILGIVANSLGVEKTTFIQGTGGFR